MKLALTALGILLDLAWAIVGTIVLGLLCIAIADFVFTALPRRMAQRFKQFHAWLSQFWGHHGIRHWKYAHL